MDAPPNVIAGQSIQISQTSAKTLPGLNGSWTVSAVGGNTVTIAYVTPGHAAIDTDSGKVKRLVYLETAVINPAASGFSYMGSHDTKNPVTGSRGAKRAVRVRRLA